jgi:hypothetical protein
VTLSQISIPGLSISQYGTRLSSSGDDILNGSAQLRALGDLSQHKENLNVLSAAVGSIHDDLESQKQKVAQTEQSISDVIGLMKLANMLVFVMFLAMFGVLILNSAAGIL